MMKNTTLGERRTPRLLAAALSLMLSLALIATGSVATGAAASAAEAGGMSAVSLQTNARTEPLGIATDPPTFSWKSTASGRGVVQSAYELRVGTSEGGDDVWSSGKVASDEQLNIRYDGPALRSQTRYYWQVRLWDGADRQGDWSAPSWFETGLETSDWQADWIGKAAGGEVDRWTDYTADIDFHIAQLAIGVFVRAADTRNAYMWQISTADGTGIPKFRPHKRVNGAYTLLDNKPIAGISSAQLLTGTHRLSVTVDGSTITTKLDGVQIDQRNDAAFAKGFVGFRQDFANNIDEVAEVKAVTVTAKTGDVLLDTDFSRGNPFNGGTLTAEGLRVGNRADVLYQSSDANRPLLRKEFSTEAGKTVKSARIYAAAHGIYQLQLNGKKVGDQFLAPGWTDYTKRIQYQSYDVTDQVQEGANALGGALANGWWAGKVGMWGPGLYGTGLSLVAQLRIDYTDGTQQLVVTDGSWKSHAGPFVSTDNIDGETYNANAEQPGWDRAGFDASDWRSAVVGASDTAKLVPQPDEPVRVTERIPAKKRTVSPEGSGVYIFDLGQNMVGVAEMKLRGTAGSTVRIRYGEELRPNGALYVGNLRAAKVTDYYTFKEDGAANYTPTFTQHGFRYVEISGVSEAPALADVTGQVWGSDLARTGDLETSDAMLNQLASNISWGQRGNFLSIPTDTPARDERLGWTGDINVFAPTASYLRDTRAFLSKWLTDLRDSARPNGDLPGIAPVPANAGGDMGTGVGWSDAAITVPYAVFQSQGDTAIVREYYAMMRKYLELVKQGAGPTLIDTARGNWNDWLNLDDPTPVSVLGTAYFAEDARMVAEMAAAIGEDADAAAYAQLSRDVRAAFADKLVAADGTVSGNSQTGYAMALGMNLVPEELKAKVGAKFLAKLKQTDYHLSTGFLGTPWLLPALSNIDRSDVAYTMLLKKDYPSWGYEIENGATTMWERWNSIKPDGSFGDEGMNSFNHYAYGAVGDWMYRNIGGISPLEPGYRTFRVAPTPGGGLTHGAGEYQSVYGTIRSDWRIEGRRMSLNVTVPVNTSAVVELPAENLLAVTEGASLLRDAEGVGDVELVGGTARFTLGSGEYHFVSDPDRAVFGALLDAIAQLDGRAGEFASDGDLSEGDRGRIGEALAGSAAKVEDALQATLDEDRPATRSRLNEGLVLVSELRSWLSGSGVDGPVKSVLDAGLGQLEALFGRAVAAALGLAVTLPPASAPAHPGGVGSGSVELANTGTTELSGLRAEVSVDGWKAAPIRLELDRLAGGAQAQLPFTVPVPRHQKPGSYRASVTVSFRTAEGTYSLRDTGAWLQVDSGVRIGEVSAAADLDRGRGTVTARIVNDGVADTTGQLVLQLPEGMVAAPASARTTVPAGQSREVEVPVLLGLQAIGGNTQIGASFVDRGAVLAQKEATLGVSIGAPAATDLPGQLDHVDFGNAASESAHALQAAAHSGTSPNEAGLTRRYAHSSYPGSWYSAEYAVEPGKPFLLRNLETFDGARTKKYNIWVDDVLVTQVQVPRGESGEGAKAYQVLIDDPRVLENTGKVRIKFEYPADASGFWDPSIADSWVLPVPDDTSGPLVSATVDSDAEPGDNGWFRGDATVTLRAVDDRPGAPLVQFGGGNGWEAYTAPIAVTGEGSHELSYRAKDAAGNSSGEQKVQVRIDGTAPVSTIRASRGAGVDGSDRADVVFSATDALSGVSALRYRIDGGEWKLADAAAVRVEGYGTHVVDYFAIDNAGNAEALRSAEIVLTDTDTLSALVVPQVGGTPVYGATLLATSGSWNTKGLSYAYQWTRDGKPIGGATAPSYRVGKADIGHRVAVTVTASKPGLGPVSVSSRAVGPVQKAGASVSVRASKASVKKGGKVRLSIRVSSAAATPSGRVRIYENGRLRASVKLLSTGAVSYGLRLKAKGKRKIQVVYTGSAVLKPARSAKTTVRVK